MTAGGNLVYYGPYQLAQKSITVLEAYGMQGPEDLENFKLTDLRKIPGFGAEACKEVRKHRDFEKFRNGGKTGIDLSIEEEKPEPVELPQINVCLQVTKSGPFRLRHYEWVHNVIKNFSDPGTGITLSDESDLMTLLIVKMYAADPSKGGTRGVPTGKGDGQGCIGLDYTPQLNA